MLQSDSTYWTYSIQLEQEVIHNLIMIRLEQKFIHNLIMIRTSKTSTQYHRVRLKSTITKFEKLTREPFASNQKFSYNNLSQTCFNWIFQPST